MARMSAEARREELIQAAVRVLEREGVAAATTRAIAAEAGANLARVHYCFDSRDQLLEEAGRRLTDDAVANVRRAYSDEADLQQGVARLLKTFWEGIETAPNLELVGYELREYALRQEGARELAEHQLSHYLEVHEELLETVATRAGVEWTVPPDILARFIHASLDGLSLSWLVDKDSTRSEQVLDLMTNYIVSCARPRQKDRRG